jgi:hypothetical protein
MIGLENVWVARVCAMGLVPVVVGGCVGFNQVDR